MGNNSSSSISWLKQGQVVSSSSLRAELARYAKPQKELSKEKLKRFLRESADLVGFPPPDDLIAALDFEEKTMFSIDFCVSSASFFSVSR
jgi:hypothetical protein